MLRVVLSIAIRNSGMVEDKKHKAARRALFGRNQLTDMERGNNTIVRVCMIGFGIAIAAIAPVVWVWKIPLFLSIILLVGVLLPAIQRARPKPY
jgi:Flp pilus assembly protein TadB